MKTARISLLEVIIGIWSLAVIVIVAGAFFVSDPSAYILGELVGSATSSAMMLHLYRCIDIELDLPENKAVNHSRIMGTVRSAIEIAVLCAGFLMPDRISPYTILAGLLARKAAALMAPWMEKIRTRGNKTDSNSPADGSDCYKSIKKGE